jgi:hypothetical protein
VDRGTSQTDQETRARRLLGQTVDRLDSKEFVRRQVDRMRLLSVGMAGMTHEKDIRIAEGLSDLELPNNFPEAIQVWNKALNRAVMQWHTAQGVDMPDLDFITNNGLIVGVEFCFPHFFFLPTWSSSSAYRIRPLGPEECLFELYSLTRYPPGQEPPMPARPTPMAPDDPRWPPIPTQDFSNLPRQQKGLHAGGFEYMRLSNQIEGMIANYQRLIDGYLAGLPYEKLVPGMQHVHGFLDSGSYDLGF